MSPGNCSGSYSEPPRARAIALRSSSCPREVDATTFSIRNLVMGTPPGPALRKPARLTVTGRRPCLILFPSPAGRGPAGPPDCGILPGPLGLEALHAAVRLGPPQQAQERLGLRSAQRDH